MEFWNKMTVQTGVCHTMAPETVNEIMKRFKPHAMLNHFQSMLHIYKQIPILEMYNYPSI